MATDRITADHIRADAITTDAIATDFHLVRARETARRLQTWAFGAPRTASGVMAEAAACILVLAAEVDRLRSNHHPPCGENPS